MRNALVGFFLLAACQGGMSPGPAASATALSTAMAEHASPGAVTTLPVGSLAIASRKLLVDVADTFETRRQGLSGRAELAADSGLVLWWQVPEVVSIWMPDMNFPIDVVFVAKDRVIAIYPDAQPCEPDEPCPDFGPKQPCDYVLEVPAGSAKAWGLTVGASAVLTRP